MNKNALPVIDVHTHAFHPKIAQKAIQQLQTHYENPIVGNGTLEDLLKRLDHAHIDQAWVHCAATTPEQVVPANDWALYLQNTYPRLTAFGTIHPGYADWENELSRLKNNGIRGIKLHPDFQGFWLTDPRLDPIFNAIGRDFVVMIHVGDIYPPSENPSCPFKMAQIASKHADTTMIAAHFGGYLHWPYVIEALSDSSIYMDTSSSMEFIHQQDLNLILQTFPIERLLYGSDYPMWDPAEEMAKLKKRTGFSDKDMLTVLTNGHRLIPDHRSR